MADNLHPASLSWALTHILRFGDTDLFPVPFEYSAIENEWDTVAKKLGDLDLSDYEGGSLRRFLVPKHQGGYRIALQLDPIDTLIYTAIVYEAAELIEKQRISVDRKVACSYRVEIDEKGQFFRTNNGWPDFFEKRKELADSGKYNYVLIADIADFYNQISHHRVRNAFEISGVSAERAKNIEAFLMNLTALQSKGIPVGPSASIIISEACLNDVDTFLLRKGYIHTRYSDDFRIFCATRLQAFQALHDLCDYLYTSHRLTLQSSKTMILPLKNFVDADLLDPEKLEEQKRTEKLKEIIEILQGQISESYGQLTNDQTVEELMRKLAEREVEIVRQNIVELFDMCLKKHPLNLGLARYLLRRAASLQTGVLQTRVLDNLDTLSPVMRDVAKYLTRTVRNKTSTEIGNSLIKFMETSDLSFVPYLKLWVTEIFLEKLALKFSSSAYGFFEKTREQLGIRPLALLARELKYIDWVREQKEVWNNHGPWDRRAIIWSASVLPTDERNFWLKRVQKSGDFLDKVMAKAVLAGVSHDSSKTVI